MKKLLAFIAAMLMVNMSMAQDSVYLFSYFKNNGEDGLHLAYSKDGLQFEALRNDHSFLQPVLSKDSLMRDPCVVRGADGLFHMVWTVSWGERGIGYASSKDLIHWSKQQYIPVMQHEDSALNCWAPEITYDHKKNHYVIYWATTITGRFAKGAGAGDEKYNHRMYYVTTKDFNQFSATKLMYDQNFNVIDATVFSVGKKYAMILKDETKVPPQKNLRITFSKYPHKEFGQPSAPITGKYWAEGPTVAKVGHEWIVYFDKYTQGQYGAVSSVDLLNWADISPNISFPKGARHGTVLKISAAELAPLLALQ